MSWLSSLFGGKKSAPQLPHTTIPSVGGYVQYDPLEKFGLDRMRGVGVGFGDDYLSKTTNPVIAQREAAFKNKTIPTLSNQASARGLGRSSLVTSQIGEAEQEKNRDIDSMVAQFYHLNELQKKQDITEGVGVNERLLNAQSNRGVQQAQLDASREQNQAQLGLGYDKMSADALGNIAAGAGGFAGAGGVNKLLGKFGFGAKSTTPALDDFGIPGLSRPKSSKTRLLEDDTYSWLDEYFGGGY